MPRILFAGGQLFLTSKQPIAKAHQQRLVIPLPPTLKTALLYDLDNVKRVRQSNQTLELVHLNA